MKQERLCWLSLMAIESELTKSLDFKDIVLYMNSCRDEKIIIVPGATFKGLDFCCLINHGCVWV